MEGVPLSFHSSWLQVFCGLSWSGACVQKANAACRPAAVLPFSGRVSLLAFERASAGE